MKIERTLKAWGRIIVKVITDEDMEDMEWAVVTEDHGDEYLIVKTKDKKLYKYGCFENLKDSKWILDGLEKKPEFFKKMDAKTSNDIFFLIKNNFYESHSSFVPRKCFSKEDAQRKFDYVIERLNEIHSESEYMYDSNSHKDEAIKFLSVNEIDTEENIKKVNTAYWDSRIDGIDGFAGKDDISDWDSIYFESMGDVYIVNKEDLDIIENYETDRWGISGYYLNVEPDPVLAANKRLYALVSDLEDEDEDNEMDWEDWMNGEEVGLSDSVSVLFNKTFISEPGCVLYLVIDKSNPERPVAQYINADKALELIERR